MIGFFPQDVVWRICLPEKATTLKFFVTQLAATVLKAAPSTPYSRMSCGVM